MNLFTLRRYFLMPALALLFFTSCKKDIYTSEIYIKKQWKVDLSTSKITPAIADRTDHAVAVLYLMDNNELHYDVYFDQPLQNGDTAGAVKINLGAAGTNGVLLIDLKNPAFDANRESKGSLTIDAQTANALISQSTYLVVVSQQQAAGLVRGQVNN
ncbi:CHRD domain-containing protein [Pedobacter sp. ISL-68]|uniref:CHRD domain-containing protein n=1 Tax=unclassified Pedobacter TaxID=2628915 RepID=UPI001BE6326E|nr:MULTISPECIES: CHRD domain-containing protein [unclassified Pedobacter]MBT2562182.1 CHRD domain-containing protein [Pedobacter sp. ISL-64]MBT2591769.1 CHRD domain-containing protein [Pedobacter sp. ISL-68]